MKISKQYSGEELLHEMKAKLKELSASTNTTNIAASLDVTDDYIQELCEAVVDDPEIESTIDVTNYLFDDYSIIFNYTWAYEPMVSQCPLEDLTGHIDADVAYIVNGILFDLDNYEDEVE